MLQSATALQGVEGHGGHRTWRDFCVVISPTRVLQPLIALIGSKSIPMIKLLIGMCLTATCSHPPVRAREMY